MSCELLADIGREFPLIVRTPYHVQIAAGGGYHDLWLSSKEPGIKYRLYGKQHVCHIFSEAGVRRLKEEIRRYRYQDSDQARLASIKSLVGRFLAYGREGIFCDAGFRQGQARLCVVRILADGDMDVTIRHVTCEGPAEAERLAVDIALRMYPGDEPVHTDFQNLQGGRVVWVPRHANRTADSFGNLRGKGHERGRGIHQPGLVTATEPTPGEPCPPTGSDSV